MGTHRIGCALHYVRLMLLASLGWVGEQNMWGDLHIDCCNVLGKVRHLQTVVVPMDYDKPRPNLRCRGRIGDSELVHKEGQEAFPGQFHRIASLMYKV